MTPVNRVCTHSLQGGLPFSFPFALKADTEFMPPFLGISRPSPLSWGRRVTFAWVFCACLEPLSKGLGLRLSPTS